MVRRMSEYERCPICLELVSDVEDCANCKHRCGDTSMSRGRNPHPQGKRGAPTLDIQERNSGFWGDD